jgi:hypothetical protein
MLGQLASIARSTSRLVNCANSAPGPAISLAAGAGQQLNDHLIRDPFVIGALDHPPQSRAIGGVIDLRLGQPGSLARARRGRRGSHGGSPPAPHRSADSENFFSVLKA